jgi:hypothetical protein
VAPSTEKAVTVQQVLNQFSKLSPAQQNRFCFEFCRQNPELVAKHQGQVTRSTKKATTTEQPHISTSCTAVSAPTKRPRDETSVLQEIGDDELEEDLPEIKDIVFLANLWRFAGLNEPDQRQIRSPPEELMKELKESEMGRKLYSTWCSTIRPLINLVLEAKVKLVGTIILVSQTAGEYQEGGHHYEAAKAIARPWFAEVRRQFLSAQDQSVPLGVLLFIFWTLSMIGRSTYWESKTKSDLDKGRADQWFQCEIPSVKTETVNWGIEVQQDEGKQKSVRKITAPNNVIVWILNDAKWPRSFRVEEVDSVTDPVFPRCFRPKGSPFFVDRKEKGPSAVGKPSAPKPELVQVKAEPGSDEDRLFRDMRSNLAPCGFGETRWMVHRYVPGGVYSQYFARVKSWAQVTLYRENEKIINASSIPTTGWDSFRSRTWVQVKEEYVWKLGRALMQRFSVPVYSDRALVAMVRKYLRTGDAEPRSTAFSLQEDPIIVSVVLTDELLWKMSVDTEGKPFIGSCQVYEGDVIKWDTSICKYVVSVAGNNEPIVLTYIIVKASEGWQAKAMMVQGIHTTVQKQEEAFCLGNRSGEGRYEMGWGGPVSLSMSHTVGTHTFTP